MSIRPIFREGICRRCRQRVTLAWRSTHHQRDGRPCGPVETHSPMAHAGVPTDTAWLQRASADAATITPAASPAIAQRAP